MKTGKIFTVAIILALMVYKQIVVFGNDILGLFTLTKCEEGFELDCENALFNEDRFLEHNRLHLYSDIGKVCTKDSENDSDTVLEILLPLVLTKEAVDMHCRGNSSLQITPDKGFILFTYMSFQLTRIATSIVVPFRNVIFIGVTDQQMYPTYYLENMLTVYSYESSFGEKMHTNEFIRLKNDLNVSYGAMINLRDSSRNLAHSYDHVRNCNEDSAMCLYTRKNPEDCYKEIVLDVRNKTDINKTMSLLSRSNISFVVLSGEGHLHQIFQHNFGKRLESISEKFFITYRKKSTSLPENPRDPKTFVTADVLLNFSGYFAINRFFYFISGMSNTLINSKDILELLFQSHGLQEFLLNQISCLTIKFIDWSYKCKSPITYKLWIKIPRNIRKSLITRFLNNALVTGNLIELWKQLYYISKVDYKFTMRQHIFNPKLALESKPYCYLQRPHCRKGEELFHSFFKEPQWMRSYGWNCQRCLAGYYKANDGNIDKCIPCLYPLVTNDQHLTCYDPYKLLTPQLDDGGNILIICASATTSLMVLITIFVFSKHKNTPIVLSANRTMTMLQLSMHMILAIIPPVLFFAKLSETVCILRQTVIGLGFAVTISVNICKTQKLFLIVNKNVLMSKSEILLTRLSEWIIIFSVICINGLFQLLTLLNEEITVDIKYFDDLMEKERYCSNNLGVYLQITFATILVFCNGVQGFRGRRLPSQFKETNHVIYSSFISLIVFFASTTVYFLTKRESIKDYVITVTMLILDFTHFILLYAYKVYLIVVKPEMNTKNVFTETRLKNLRLQST